MFATILYGFAFGRDSLRDLEEACKYDLRYIYLMEQKYKEIAIEWCKQNELEYK